MRLSKSGSAKYCFQFIDAELSESLWVKNESGMLTVMLPGEYEDLQLLTESSVEIKEIIINAL